MFHKLNLTLLSATLFLSAIALAEPPKEEAEQLSFCYGYYSAVKDKAEVSRNNDFLKNVGDGTTYDKIVNNPLYKQGYSQASTLDRRKKHFCLGMVYGFLGVGYKMAGQKDTKTDLDLAYCMGYVNEARLVPDSEMVQEFCDTEKNLTPQDKKECLFELGQIIKHNTGYQAGRREAKAELIHPLRVMNCVMKINRSSETELDKAMGTHQKNPQAQKPPKRPKPPKRKENVTTPVFR